MAGALVETQERLFRLGQQGQGDYGNGLVLFTIDQLARSKYQETEVGRFRLASAKGPHTLNFREGRAVFDWYQDRFSPVAGLRRIKNRLRRRPASQLQNG
jgi:hypothetical protein